MRVLPAALAISAAVHGAAIAWAITRKHSPPLVKPDVVAVATPRVEPSEPIAIELVDPPAMAAATVTGGTRDVGPTHTRIAASRRSTETAPPAPDATAQPPSSSSPPIVHGTAPLMTMRAPKFGLSDEELDTLATLAPQPLPKREPSPIESERIAGEIADAEQKLHDPGWIAHASPEEVGALRRSLPGLYDARDSVELKPDERGGGYHGAHETFSEHVDPDGTMHFKDKGNWQQSGLTGSFDTTDAIMRRLGQDPYASQKRRILDDTRDERYEIGKRFRHDQLAHSDQLALQTLDWIWKQTGDVRERKRAVFELWDDCAESGDADLVQGARDARATIATFVQAHLTGSDAYTPGELAELNAHKTSTATFAPYER
ncbi:MAG TPA: hypothetical protein VGL61_17795 [Kofleriaceae bacterium]|jgi:hypothetical protein